MKTPSRTSLLLPVIIVALLFTACQVQELDAPSTGAPPTLSPEESAPIPEVPELPQEWIEVYFTGENGSPAAAQAALVEAIDGAQQQVDMAMFNLSLTPVQAALIRAHERGLTVRVLTDSEALAKPSFRALQRAGIPLIGDRREALMHNKYIIIDDSEVWTGSLNLTGSGLNQDNNNLVRLHSAELARLFTADFEAMFEDDRFDDKESADASDSVVNLDGVKVEVFFSPNGGADDRIAELLSSATDRIDFLAYSFTSDSLAQALIAAAKSGVQVSGVMEADQVESNTGGEFENFQNAGLDVFQDGNSGLMHHKLIIIDQSIVIFGSYNFSRNAERSNNENLLIIHDAGLAAQFMPEVEQVTADAAH